MNKIWDKIEYPVITSIKRNKIDIVKWLMNSDEMKDNINLNSINENNETCLYWCVKHNNFELFKSIMTWIHDWNKFINIKPNNDISIFLLICSNGYINFLKYLFDVCNCNKYIDLLQTDLNNNNALQLSINNKHIKMIKYLLFNVYFAFNNKQKDGIGYKAIKNRNNQQFNAFNMILQQEIENMEKKF